MKTQLLLIGLLLTTSSLAQHLNQAGHLINTVEDSPSVPIKLSTKGDELKIGSLTLRGNSVFRIPDGFITLSGSDENITSVFRIYSKMGEELYSQGFDQTINFMLSPGKNFCAFHDRNQINIVNLEDRKIRALDGSNIFAIDDEGDVAYYDERTSTLNFKNESAAINEPVYRALIFKGQPLFMTRKSVVTIKNNLAEVIFTATEGRVFDAAVFNDKLFISVKKETTGEFIFNSFSSNNLLSFSAEEEMHYPLMHPSMKLNGVHEFNKLDSLDNEVIRDPLYYYQDTAYQPVGNSYDEMQEYSIGFPYLHPGVDLLGTYLQNVYAVKSGYVKAILTTSAEYHWRVAIANENTSGYSQGYLYAHLEESTIPYTVGDFVNEGDVVAQLVNFPVDGFVHCHFARIGDEGSVWNGDWWTFDNPLSYMTNLFDSIPPQFEKTIGNDAFAFRDEDGNYLSPDSLYGKVRVISKVYDQVNAEWRVEVNKLRYNVSPLSFPQDVLLDSFAYEYNWYNDDYFEGPYYTTVLNTIYSRDPICYSTADYEIREYYHIVTNSDGNDTIDSNDPQQFFNTLTLADGSYIFRVIASDPSENTTVDSMIIQVKNGITGFNNLSLHSPIKIFPNPFSSVISVSISKQESQQTMLTIQNMIGQTVFKENIYNYDNDYSKRIDLSFLDEGIYLLDVAIDGEHTIRKIIKQ